MGEKIFVNAQVQISAQACYSAKLKLSAKLNKSEKWIIVITGIFYVMQVKVMGTLKALKAFIKPFEAPQTSVKIKI